MTALLPHGWSIQLQLEIIPGIIIATTFALMALASYLMRTPHRTTTDRNAHQQKAGTQ